jgi:hypothetical protein
MVKVKGGLSQSMRLRYLLRKRALGGGEESGEKAAGRTRRV